jgi:hypothetical protein
MQGTYAFYIVSAESCEESDNQEKFFAGRIWDLQETSDFTSQMVMDEFLNGFGPIIR